MVRLHLVWPVRYRFSLLDIGSIFLTIKPIWIGCVSTIIVADFFYLAGFLANERRLSRKPVSSLPLRVPTDPAAADGPNERIFSGTPLPVNL